MDDSLKILTDDEVKDFVVKNFGKWFKSKKKNCTPNFVKNFLVKLLHCFISS